MEIRLNVVCFIVLRFSLVFIPFRGAGPMMNLIQMKMKLFNWSSDTERNRKKFPCPTFSSFRVALNFYTCSISSKMFLKLMCKFSVIKK